MNRKPSLNKTIKLKLLGRLLRYFVIAAVLSVVGIGVFLYFNIYLPRGSGPAGPDVPAKPFERIWSEQNVLLLGIGDSITDGFGASEGFSYFDRLIKNPQQDSKDMLGKNLAAVFPNLRAKNIAVSGSTSLGHLKQIQGLEPQSSNVLGIVVMTTGGNDLIHNYGRTSPKEGAMYGATLEEARPWVNNFEKRLAQMIISIKEVFPGRCHIFLANIYDPSDGTGDTKSWLTGLPTWADGLSILRAYNEVISRCADKYDYVHFVDIYKSFLGHGMHCRKFWLKNYRFSDPYYWYHLNIEDPSDRGYDAIRRLFLIEIVKVFFNHKSANSSD